MGWCSPLLVAALVIGMHQCKASRASRYCARTNAKRLASGRDEDDLSVNINGSFQFGILETWLIIDAAINLHDAYKEMRMRTETMESLTSQHITGLQGAIGDFVSADRNGVIDLLKTDALADITVAFATLEDADNLCKTNKAKDFSARVQHWPQDMIDTISEKIGMSDPKERKRLDAEAKTASNTIHTISQRFKHNVENLMNDTVCPAMEDSVLENLENAAVLVSEWEQIWGRSWYLIRERQVKEDQILGTRLSSVSLIDHKQCLSELQAKEAEAHRQIYGEINLDYYAEVVISEQQAEREQELNRQIEGSLAVVERHLGDLKRYCKVPDFYAKLKENGKLQKFPGARHMLACDAYMVSGSRWAALVKWAAGRASKVGPKVGAVVKIITTVMSPITDYKLVASLVKKGHFGTHPVIPVINALSWVFLRIAMNWDVHDECVRVAGAFSGEQPITSQEMELAEKQMGNSRISKN